MHHFMQFVGPDDVTDRVAHPATALEIFFPIDAPSPVPLFACTYVLKAGDRDMVAVTNWGDVLGHAWDLFSPSGSIVAAEEYGKIWPTLRQVATNTTLGKHKKGAFAQVIDPDDGIEKWVVAMVRKNVPEDALDAKALEIAEKVALLSIDIAMEMQTDLTKSQKSRMIMRGAAAGYRQGKDAIAPVENALGWLQIALG